MDLLLGIFGLGFGLFTGVARFVAPDNGIFDKLEGMKAKMGARTGLVVHWIAYTIVPLLMGGALLAKALLYDYGG